MRDLVTLYIVQWRCDGWFIVMIAAQHQEIVDIFSSEIQNVLIIWLFGLMFTMWHFFYLAAWTKTEPKIILAPSETRPCSYEGVEWILSTTRIALISFNK